MEPKGFSLIEVMMVMIISSILAVFAYPSYQQFITQARRVDGQTALLQLATRMEDYYSEQHSYQGATLGTQEQPNGLSKPFSEQNWYRLYIVEQTKTDFKLQAIPSRAQASADILCQTLTFTSRGVKGIAPGPSGPPKGSASQCWE